MKKTSRKLFAAVASLGLAVAATAGSTYAWFSMNDTVSATGMNVRVQSESSLLISKANALVQAGQKAAGKLDNSGSTKEADANADLTDGIKPVSTSNGVNWFSAKAEASGNKAKAAADTYVAVDQANYGSYFLRRDFYIQIYDGTKEISNATNYEVYANASIVLDKIIVTAPEIENDDQHEGNDAHEDLSSCFRALFVTQPLAYTSLQNPENTGTVTKVFTAPTTSTEPTNQAVTAATTSGSLTAITFADNTYAFETKTATFSSNNELVATGNVKYNQVYKVSVFLYFDGEDTNCYSDNIPDTLANYGIDASFKIKKTNA